MDICMIEHYSKKIIFGCVLMFSCGSVEASSYLFCPYTFVKGIMVDSSKGGDQSAASTDGKDTHHAMPVESDTLTTKMMMNRSVDDSFVGTEQHDQVAIVDDKIYTLQDTGADTFYDRFTDLPHSKLMFTSLFIFLAGAARIIRPMLASDKDLYDMPCIPGANVCLFGHDELTPEKLIPEEEPTCDQAIIEYQKGESMTIRQRVISQKAGRVVSRGKSEPFEFSSDRTNGSGPSALTERLSVKDLIGRVVTTRLSENESEITNTYEITENGKTRTACVRDHEGNITIALRDRTRKSLLSRISENICTNPLRKLYRFFAYTVVEERQKIIEENIEAEIKADPLIYRTPARLASDDCPSFLTHKNKTCSNNAPMLYVTDTRKPISPEHTASIKRGVANFNKRLIERGERLIELGMLDQEEEKHND